MKFTSPISRETDYVIDGRPLLIRENGEGVSLRLQHQRTHDAVTIAWNALYRKLQNRPASPPYTTPVIKAPAPSTASAYSHVSDAIRSLGLALKSMEPGGGDYGLIEEALINLRAVDRSGI